MTGQNIFDIAMDMADERLANGSIDADSTAEYSARAIGIISSLQAELLEVGNVYNTFNYSKRFIEPIYGLLENDSHDDADIVFNAVGVAKAYTFEVDGEGTVYIEDLVGSTWNIVETITVANTVKTMTRFYGLVTPTVGSTQSRIRFSGNFYYNLANVGLYSQAFPNITKIPEYTEWIEVELPNDFRSQEQLVEDPYTFDDFVYFGGKNQMFVKYNYDGDIKLLYNAIPDDLTSLSDSLVLDDQIAKTLLVMGLVARLLATDDPDISNYYQGLYEEGFFKLKKKKPAKRVRVKDLYASSMRG